MSNSDFIKALNAIYDLGWHKDREYAQARSVEIAHDVLLKHQPPGGYKELQSSSRIRNVKEN